MHRFNDAGGGCDCGNGVCDDVPSCWPVAAVAAVVAAAVG